jgi:hypothetical protein
LITGSQPSSLDNWIPVLLSLLLDYNPPLLITGSQTAMREEGWDPVSKRGGLGSSYQERRVGIQLSRDEGWDPVIKRGGLGSSYQDRRAGIQLSREEGWDPVIKIEGLGSSYQEKRVGIQL